MSPERLLLPLILVWAVSSSAEIPGGESRCVVMPGGSFLHPPVCRYPEGARYTLFYPAVIGKDGALSPVRKPRFPDQGEWDRVVTETRERASLLLATMEPEMRRDRRGVIQAAVLRSDDPATASCILAPGFVERFRAVFGPELLVAIPSAKCLYVFPKLANILPESAEEILAEYRTSVSPVTTEFFEVSAKGIRAAGDFRGER